MGKTRTKTDLRIFQSALAEESLRLAPYTRDLLFRMAAVLGRAPAGLTAAAIAKKTGFGVGPVRRALTAAKQIGLFDSIVHHLPAPRRGCKPAVWSIRSDWKKHIDAASLPTSPLPKTRQQALERADWRAGGFTEFQARRAAMIAAAIGDRRVVSIETLADEMGVSRNTMKLYLKLLDDLGLVERRRLGMGPYEFTLHWDTIDSLGTQKDKSKRISLAPRKEQLRVGRRAPAKKGRLSKHERRTLDLLCWRKLGFRTLDQWLAAKRVISQIGTSREATCGEIGNDVDLCARVVERIVRQSIGLGLIRAEKGGPSGRIRRRKLTVDWAKIDAIATPAANSRKKSRAGQKSKRRGPAGVYGHLKDWLVDQLKKGDAQPSDLRARYRHEHPEKPVPPPQTRSFGAFVSAARKRALGRATVSLG